VGLEGLHGWDWRVRSELTPVSALGGRPLRSESGNVLRDKPNHNDRKCWADPGDGTSGAGRIPRVHDNLGKLGGWLMTLAAGAALAYFITANAQGQPSPPQTWPLWPFYLCAAMFMVGAVLYGAGHRMLPWQRYVALNRRAEAADASETEALPAVTEPLEPASLGAADPLTLTVGENERWDLWQRAGYICALPVTITNTTSQPITVISYGMGTDWHRDPDDAPVEISGEDQASLRDEARARERRKYHGAPLIPRRRNWLRRKPRTVIPPHGQVSGWLVTDCPRPWTGGRPRCTIKVTDALGNTYTKTIKQRDPAHYES